MSRVASLLRTHTLTVGFIVAIVPLVTMLGMQYVWLTRLERASAIARQAALRNYLEAVGNEVEYFYRSSAERLLNLPAALFGDGAVGRGASLWSGQSLDVATRLFVVDFTQVSTGNYYLYDRASRSLKASAATDESLAIILATLPWQARALSHEPSTTSGLQVDERDPERRIILNPVLDEEAHVVGVVGMVLDIAYFRATVLPQLVARAMPSFVDDELRANLAVEVYDGQRRPVLGSHAPPPGTASLGIHLPFVFRDWTITLTSRGASPEQWAGAAFAFDMTLGLLLAVVLVAGIGLSLRAARRAVRLSQMKSDFVSNVSHELRTPLASIRLYAELLRLGRVGDETNVRAYGERIETESRRLTRLVDDILDFARLEAHERRYAFVPTDVAALARAVARDFALRLERDGFRLHVEAPEHAEATVDADAVMQALGNLIDNAAKYSEPPSDITVRLTTAPEGLRLAVEDHGVGIAPADQRRVFERFHRIGTGLVHDVKGSGLGLSIALHIVHAHGGRIDLESTPGRGSTFTLHLPRNPPADDPSTAA